MSKGRIWHRTLIWSACLRVSPLHRSILVCSHYFPLSNFQMKFALKETSRKQCRCVPVSVGLHVSRLAAQHIATVTLTLFKILCFPQDSLSKLQFITAIPFFPMQLSEQHVFMRLRLVHQLQSTSSWSKTWFTGASSDKDWKVTEQWYEACLLFE